MIMEAKSKTKSKEKDKEEVVEEQDPSTLSHDDHGGNPNPDPKDPPN